MPFSTKKVNERIIIKKLAKRTEVKNPSSTLAATTFDLIELNQSSNFYGNYIGNL